MVHRTTEVTCHRKSYEKALSDETCYLLAERTLWKLKFKIMPRTINFYFYILSPVAKYHERACHSFWDVLTLNLYLTLENDSPQCSINLRFKKVRSPSLYFTTQNKNRRDHTLCVYDLHTCTTTSFDCRYYLAF